MIVLALDTAGTGCFAAVYDGGQDRVLASAGADIGRGHAEQLMAFVDQALEASGRTLAEIERIAVTIGPGSFTGIRVGVAAARGFSLALGVPAVGISVLEALAQSARQARPGRDVLAVMDAKRDEVYCQGFKADGAASDAPAVLSLDEARRRYAGFDGVVCGSAAGLLSDVPQSGSSVSDAVDIGIVARLGAAGLLSDVPQSGIPVSDAVEIGVVARLGAAADPGRGKPSPLYLRGPDVRSQAGFAVART